MNSPDGGSRGHAGPALFASALFAAFTLLYFFDYADYLRIMRVWMVYLLPNPFADTAFITAQLECWRLGTDVYTRNPCDVAGRVMVYSPLWLRLFFLPGGQAATVPLALASIAGFIASLTVLPRGSGKTGTVLLMAGIASPATAYAVERGNVDLLIFILAAIAVLCAERSARVRLIGHAAIVFAGLLKFYPIVMLVMIARERPKTAMLLELAAVVIVALFAYVWMDELARMLPNIPRPGYDADAVGGRRLAEALIVIAGLGGMPVRARAIMVALTVLLVIAAIFAHRLARDTRFAAAVRALSGRETLCLAAGAALFCGCFVAGSSLVYREVLLLFAIPALARFSAAAALPGPVRAAAWIMVALMWAVPLTDAAGQFFGNMDGDTWPPVTFALWLLCEAAWWWIFTLLGAALLCFARLSRAASGALPPAAGTGLMRPVFVADGDPHGCAPLRPDR